MSQLYEVDICDGGKRFIHIPTQMCKAKCPLLTPSWQIFMRSTLFREPRKIPTFQFDLLKRKRMYKIEGFLMMSHSFLPCMLFTLTPSSLPHPVGPLLSSLISFFFWDRVSLGSPGFTWRPRTHYIDQAGLELTDLCALTTRVLKLKICATAIQPCRSLLLWPKDT